MSIGSTMLIRWTPGEGPETRALLDNQSKLSAAGKQLLVAEAKEVLSKCIPPNVPPDTDTGLAIGFVQSGKTLNFTMVTALARDNGYALIIMIAGVSVPLFDQSTDRLIRDLGISTRRGVRRWRHFANPGEHDLDSIRSVLESWRPGTTIPENRRQAVLITVMKQHQRLDALK